MTWSTLTPLKQSSSRKVLEAVSLTASFPKARNAPRLRLMIHADMIGLPWLKHDVAVTVEAGEGEHRGKLRITHEGAFSVRAAGGQRRMKRPLQIILPMPEHINAAFVGVPCSFKRMEDALIVTLPGVAVPKVKLPPFPPFKGPAEDDAEPEGITKPLTRHPYEMGGPSHAKVNERRQAAVR